MNEVRASHYLLVTVNIQTYRSW